LNAIQVLGECEKNNAFSVWIAVSDYDMTAYFDLTYKKHKKQQASKNK
jgi:hypothetical protein